MEHNQHNPHANFASELGQARVKEQLEAERLARLASDGPPKEPEPIPLPPIVPELDAPLLDEPEFENVSELPESPVMTSLESLPDQDLKTLMEKFRLRKMLKFDRTKALIQLSELGITATDL